MKKLILFFVLSMLVPASIGSAAHKEEIREKEVVEAADEVSHNWKQTSSAFEMVHADTHEYTVWHNFIKKTRKCDITHRIKTEVWYCDIHEHTKSEVSLEDTIHSRRHR